MPARWVPLATGVLLLVQSCVTLVEVPITTIVDAPHRRALQSLFPHNITTVGTNATNWVCPDVRHLPDVSCVCDLPHTLRCRGYASNDTTLLALTQSLADAHVSLLDLAVHHVLQLPKGVFQGLQLLGLIVSAAGLSSLGSQTFSGLEGSLAALGLPANSFTKIPFDALQPLTRLQRIDFSDNQLEELPSRAFPTLIQLHSLSLAGNKIRIIQPEAFVKLPQMRTLNLNRNKLDASQISERTLWGLHVLRELSLQNNLLKGSISPNFISGAATITSLDLSYNALTSITMGALSAYKHLQVLDLSYNQIDIIEDHALQHLQNLQELVLAHNRVVAVSGWSFAHVPLLTTLRLADNALLAVTADLVHQLPSLTTLDLAANDISLLQPHIFNNTPKLEHLNLADNPLHCDCTLAWLRGWLATTAALEGNERRSGTCATPLHLQNAPLVELKAEELTCSDHNSDYHDFYSDYYHDAATQDYTLSNAEVSLQVSRWTTSGLQLIWKVDERALPYACEAVFVYEVYKLPYDSRELLTEKVDANCSSQSQRDPERVSVTIPGDILQVGSTYKYCLVLLEYGTSDQEGFLPGCSEPLLLAAQPLNLPAQSSPPPEVNSLTAGGQGGVLVVHTRIRSSETPCTYTVVVVRSRTIAASRQLNCSEARHTFLDLTPGQYTACVAPDSATSIPHNLLALEHLLHATDNATHALHSTFPACTPLTELQHSSRSWQSEPLAILLFTLPGLALIITLYIIGRRVWRGGGVPWKWDPRANKSAKYFLYTGETNTPSVSLDPLPSSTPETTTRV
ncbi:Leucine-rich repeat [Trinorchestia longiramus]|nr:Leucine-rich repeat [Trinorchestia longiramus]